MKKIRVTRKLEWVCSHCAETIFGKRLNGFRKSTVSKAHKCDVCDMKPRSGGACSPPGEYGITPQMWTVKVKK